MGASVTGSLCGPAGEGGNGTGVPGGPGPAAAARGGSRKGAPAAAATTGAGGPPARAEDLLDGDEHDVRGGSLQLVLEGYGYRWFRIRRAGEPVRP